MILELYGYRFLYIRVDIAPCVVLADCVVLRRAPRYRMSALYKIALFVQLVELPLHHLAE